MSALDTWALDWADHYDQGQTEESLRSFVGKLVMIEAPARDEDDEPKKATIRVGGYSIVTLVAATKEDPDAQDVHQYLLLSDQGQGIPLFASCTITEVDESEEG